MRRLYKHSVRALALAIVLLGSFAFAISILHTTDADFAGGTFSGTESDAAGGVIIDSVNKNVDWLNGDLAVEDITGNHAIIGAIISDGAGGAYIAWEDYRHTTPFGVSDIFIQRVDEDGNALWTSSGVDISTTTGSQYEPKLALDGAGGVIVVWYDNRAGASNRDIYGQRFNSSGVAQWTQNGLVIESSAGNQHFSEIVSDGSGGAYVGWVDAASGGISLQRINSSGATQWGSPTQATVTSGAFRMTADGSGNVVVAWVDSSQASSQIFAQKFDSSGAAQWGAGSPAYVPVAATSTAGQKTDVRIATDESGGAVIAWKDTRGGTFDIYAQRVDNTGAVQWTVDGVAIVAAAGTQQSQNIVSDGAGGAILAWNDQRSGNDIYAQRINDSGVVQWTADGVGISTSTGNQTLPSLVSDGSGGAVIAWQDARSGVTNDVYAQRINSSGSVQWTVNGIAISAGTADNQTFPRVTSDGAGGALITWLDDRSAANSGRYGVYMQRVAAGAPLTVAYPDGYFANLATSSSAIDWSAETLTWGETTPAGTDITFSTRILWADEFDGGGVANISDCGWGYDTANSITESGGIITFTDFAGTSDKFCNVIDTGAAADYYPVGTNVYARVRVNGTSPYFALITEDWNGSQAETTLNNTWVNLEYAETVTFDNLAIYLDVASAALQPTDSIEIDYVYVEPALSFGTWDALSGSSITSGTGYYLQYRAFLDSTTNLNTPTLESVTIGTSVSAPTVITAAASSVSQTGATLNGEITATGGENATARGFVYGTTVAYGATTTDAGSYGTGTFDATVSSLTCGTTYHFTSYATNSGGTSYGSDTTFDTSACSSSSGGGGSAAGNGPIVGSFGPPPQQPEFTLPVPKPPKSPEPKPNKPEPAPPQDEGPTVPEETPEPKKPKKEEVPEQTPEAPEAAPIVQQAITISSGITELGSRAFSWNETERVIVTRSINGGPAERIAVLNPKTRWFVDADVLGESDVVYTFTTPRGASQDVAFSLEPVTTTAPVISEDVDGDGSAEEFVEGVFQDTDGSSSPVGSIDEGVLLDTNTDGSADTFWLPGVGTTTVSTTPGGLVLGNGSLTGNSTYEMLSQALYNVTVQLLTASAAVALESVHAVPIAPALSLAVPEIPETIATLVLAGGVVASAIVLAPAASGSPFSLLDMWRLVVHFLSSPLAFFSARKRKRSWGTVYDSVTKEPLDPAYVQLFDENGKEVASSITDLDGRYGFLLEQGSYTMRAQKTHYAFPSQRLAGRTHDMLYSDLYFGEPIVTGNQTVIAHNVPLDPVETDWNQVQKRELGLMRYVSHFDPYVLAVFDVLFVGGIVFALWQLASGVTFENSIVVGLYAALVFLRFFTGRPPLYGTVTRRDGTPLSYGVVEFFVGDAVVATKVIDRFGRYIGILPPGAYTMRVEERAGTEELVPVFETSVNARGGVVNKRIVVG